MIQIEPESLTAIVAMFCVAIGFMIANSIIQFMYVKRIHLGNLKIWELDKKHLLKKIEELESVSESFLKLYKDELSKYELKLDPVYGSYKLSLKSEAKQE